MLSVYTIKYKTVNAKKEMKNKIKIGQQQGKEKSAEINGIKGIL